MTALVEPGFGNEFITEPLPAIRAAIVALDLLINGGVQTDAADALAARNTLLEDGLFQSELAANTETLTAAGAVTPHATKMRTAFDTTLGAQTATIGAASRVGQIKVMEMTVDGGDVTVAMTNVIGQPTGTTFKLDDVGDCVVLFSVGVKWLYLGGNPTIT